MFRLGQIILVRCHDALISQAGCIVNNFLLEKLACRFLAFNACEIADGLTVIRGLQFASDSLAPVQHRAVAFTSHSHKWGQDYFSGIRPQNAGAFDHVELEGANVLLVFWVACGPKVERARLTNIHPYRAGILPPDVVTMFDTFSTRVFRSAVFRQAFPM